MSTATHGYNNTLAQGKPYYNTVHRLGSGKTGQNVILKSVAERTANPQPVVSVTSRDKNKEFIIEITAHGAKVGDICRFYTGAVRYLEYDIVEVIDANSFVIQNIGGGNPAVADTAKIMFYVTSKADSEGNVNFSPGPTQFVHNAVSTQVEQDDAVPANNKPLPTGLYYYKDGVIIPVRRDTVTPSNNAPLPVELIGFDGGTINITSGDINVQLSDMGATFDSARIGDGSGVYLKVNADGSINVVSDALTEVQLRSAPLEVEASSLPLPSGAATSALQTSGNTLLGAVTETAPATDTASSGINGRLQRIAQRLTSLIALLPTSVGQKTSSGSLPVVLPSDQVVPVSGDFYPATQPVSIASQPLPTGAATAALQTSGNTLLGAVTETAPANDTASSGLNGRLQRIAQRLTSLIGLLPTSIGQKTTAQSLAVTLPSDQTVPVSMTEVPLPTGAASETKLTEIDTVLDTIAAKLPASLGEKTGATSLSVVPATDATFKEATQAGTITSTQKTVGTTAVRGTVSGSAPNTARKRVIFKPSKNNTGNIYIGGSTVTTGTGMEIIGPDRLEFTYNSSDWYLISDTVGQKVEIIEVV